MSLRRRSSFAAAEVRALSANAPASATDRATSNSANNDASMTGDSPVRSASVPMATDATISASISAWGIQTRFAASESATASEGVRQESIPKRSVMRTPLSEAEKRCLQANGCDAGELDRRALQYCDRERRLRPLNWN